MVRILVNESLDNEAFPAATHNDRNILIAVLILFTLSEPSEKYSRA